MTKSKRSQAATFT